METIPEVIEAHWNLRGNPVEKTTIIDIANTKRVYKDELQREYANKLSKKESEFAGLTAFVIN